MTDERNPRLAVAIESLIAGVEQARLSHILTFVQVAGWSTAGTDVVSAWLPSLLPHFSDRLGC